MKALRLVAVLASVVATVGGARPGAALAAPAPPAPPASNIIGGTVEQAENP